MKKTLIWALSAVSVITAASATTGCVAENFDNCPIACRLTFKYTNNPTRQDLFAGNVGAITVYVFDDTDVLTKIVEVSPDDIAQGYHDIARLSPGRYTMVAWGVTSEDMTRSFTTGHMPNPSTHNPTALKPGTTTRDDLYMILNSVSAPADIEGDIVPEPAGFDNLFHAIAEGVEIIAGKSRLVKFDFTRDTSVLKIEVKGLEYFDTPSAPNQLPLRLFATGANSRYRYDNSIDAAAPTVHYASYNERRTNYDMTLNIPMLRMHIARHADDPVLLYIERANGTAIPGLRPIDLVRTIAASTDGMGYYPYKTQEAIDREDEFRITIDIRPDPDNPGMYILLLSINEWGVVILKPDVDQKDYSPLL